MRAFVATVFDSGRYEMGAAALINSLVRSGFQGTVYCGVRGPQPRWLREPPALAGIQLRAVSVDSDLHLANYKARFLLDLFDENPDCDAGIYFDPDIVVKCSWVMIEDWYAAGIAVVADGTWMVPSSSPFWVGLRRVREQMGVPPAPGEDPGPLSIYCNSGFVAVPAGDRAFLQLWDDLIVATFANNLQLDIALSGRPGISSEREPINVIGPDQDLFNLALMSFVKRISIRGPDAMDLAPGGVFLSHAVMSPKPWDKRFIRDALIGRPPNKRDGAFLQFASGPVPVMSAAEARRRQLAYKVARGIGGLFRRDDY